MVEFCPHLCQVINMKTRRPLSDTAIPTDTVPSITGNVSRPSSIDTIGKPGDYLALQIGINLGCR